MSGPATSQRLDKWLWCARFVKTRQKAVALVQAGHVRIEGRRPSGPDRPVHPGVVLTLALPHATVVVRVLSLADRRGPAEEARRLYEPVTPLCEDAPS